MSSEYVRAYTSLSLLNGELMLSLLFEFLYHQLGGFIYVAAAECYHKIALFDILDNIVSNLFKGVEPYASGNLLGELRGVDIICVSRASPLSRSEPFCPECSERGRNRRRALPCVNM